MKIDIINIVKTLRKKNDKKSSKDGESTPKKKNEFEDMELKLNKTMAELSDILIEYNLTNSSFYSLRTFLPSKLTVRLT